MRSWKSDGHLIIFLILLLPHAAYAELEDLGNGLVYDSDQAITWLQDANHVKSLCDADDPIWRAWMEPADRLANTTGRSKQAICQEMGSMNGYEAIDWIAHLNRNAYLGFTGWRLPLTNQPDPTCSYTNFDGQDYGYGCTGSEMGHLQLVSLANPDGFTEICWDLNCLDNTGPFSHFPIDPWYLGYWSSDEVSQPSNSWHFLFSESYQGLTDKFLPTLQVWPVMDGRAITSLASLGYGVINDHSQNIAWLADANHLKSLCDAGDPLWLAWPEPNPAVVDHSGRSKAEICSADATLNWYEAEAWIDHLNANRYLGRSDWRQPATQQPDSSCSETDANGQDLGYRCSGSELGHLYRITLENGNALDDACGPDCLSRTGPFDNLQSALHWSGSSYAPDETSAWSFDTRFGEQMSQTKQTGLATVWPVATGLSAPALVDLGNGLVQDTLQDLTWVQDANLVKTLCDANDPLWQSWPEPSEISPVFTTRTKAGICSGNGRMEWHLAEAWIDHLNANNYLGYSDWRQPRTQQPDSSCLLTDSNGQGWGRLCRGSELPVLFHQVLNNPECEFDLNVFDCRSNSGPFQGYEASYWSGSEYSPNLQDAWWFEQVNATQWSNAKSMLSLNVWPVRSNSTQGDPIVSLYANGVDEPLVYLDQGARLRVHVALDPQALSGVDADWWLRVETPGGTYWYSQGGWVADNSLAIPAYQGPLLLLQPYQVLDRSGLSPGAYRFTFAVDENRDGVFDKHYHDSVRVIVR